MRQHTKLVKIMREVIQQISIQISEATQFNESNLSAVKNNIMFNKQDPSTHKSIQQIMTLCCQPKRIISGLSKKMWSLLYYLLSGVSSLIKLLSMDTTGVSLFTLFQSSRMTLCLIGLQVQARMMNLNQNSHHSRNWTIVSKSSSSQKMEVSYKMT